MFLGLGLRLSLFPEGQFPRSDCYWQGYFWKSYFREVFSRVSTKARTKSFDPVYSSDMADSTSCHHFAEQAVTRRMMRSLYL